jgi:hypothetical protein
MGEKGILFMIDLDVPRNGTRVELLHWFAYNVDIGSTPIKALMNSGGAPYLQPSPPAGDIAHRYVFYMFAQPRNFTVPTKFKKIDPPASTSNRIGFSLTAFAADAGLGMPLASNYIRVQNMNSTPAASSSSPLPTEQGSNATATMTLSPPAPASTSSSGGGSTPAVMAGGLLAGLLLALA